VKTSSKTPLVALIGATLAALSANPALAASESCSYNAGTKAVTATIADGGAATLRVGPGGELLFGASPVACGAATTTNTNTVAIAGAPGTIEALTLDQSGGAFGPGAATENNFPEIEMTIALGDAGDELVFIGTPAADSIAVGASGLSFNADGDVDATFSPLPAHFEVDGGGGGDFLTGRGGWGSGLAFAGSVTLVGGSLADELNGGNGDDLLLGGDGNDVMNGSAGHDEITAGPGTDTLSGGDGNDFMVGGAGADSLVGGFGNDLLLAFDGEADTLINGGPDTDTSYFDPGIDPSPSASERSIGAAPIESCEYDAGAKTVTARLEPGGDATLKVTSGGDLLLGTVPVPCGGATTANTDSISVSGAAGIAEKFTVDQTQGFLGPGFTPEFNLPEIEMVIGLGDAGDVFSLVGTEGADTLTAGLSGVSLNSDGDLDVTFSPLPGRIELHGRGGVNFITARGGFGAGLAYPHVAVLVGGDLGDELNGGTGDDIIIGGAGADVMNGSGGHDTMTGGGAGDRLSGGGGNDSIFGGPGADELIGSEGDDFLDANDDEADVQIHAGAGVDTAYYDAGIDPGLTAVENPVADPGEEPPPPPPPPPPGECVYRSADKEVVATMPTSAEATLYAVGGEIRFGAAPVACGAATTLNTDTITVVGATGTAERLVVDQSTGLLAPGATAEGNIAEIELEIELGDTADEVAFVATEDADTMAAGANGVSLNSDGDLDVTFSPMPGSIEIEGRGGADFLTGRGGLGAGLAYTGALTLLGGDAGDELNGGNGHDVIMGGAGNDAISSYVGNDLLDGGSGDDSLSGSDGNDTLVGGSGSDTLLGGFDADVLQAGDDEADAQIHGGPGADTAYVDVGLDPATIAVETVISD